VTNAMHEVKVLVSRPTAFYMYFALTITHTSRRAAEGLGELMTSRGHKVNTRSVGDTTANVYTLAGLRTP